MKKLFQLILLLLFPLTVLAAPLPDGTKLSITQGSGSASNTPCTSGSCFGMEVAPNFVIWTDFGPGTDGGFVVGRSQLSGGQETGPSSGIMTKGSLTTAWLFFGNFGTFFTSPNGETNVFDDADCVGAGCIGKTELKVFHVAWNGNVIPMGSAAGCTLPSCSAEQLAGVFTKKLTVMGDSYTLEHAQVVPNGAFTGVKFQANITGTVSLPLATTKADAGPDRKDVLAGSVVGLAGTCTETDPTATIIDCSWSEPVGQNQLTNTSNPTSFTPLANGTYTFTLCNTSTAGTACDSVTVFVTPAAVPIQTSTKGCSLGTGQTDSAWMLIGLFLFALWSRRFA